MSNLAYGLVTESLSGPAIAPGVLMGGLALALCLLCAVGVWVFGHRADEPAGKIHALTWGFTLAGPLVGWWIYSVDTEQRRVTLHEVVLECTPDELGRSLLEVEIEVLHSGVEHLLVLAPRPATFGSANGPCLALARWINPNGSVLLEGHQELTTRWTSRRAIRKTWDSAHWRFTPNALGLHRLMVEVVHPDAAKLLVRVEDPLGPGRPRAAGY